MATSKNYFDILDDEVPKKAKVEIKDGNDTQLTIPKKPRASATPAVVSAPVTAPVHKENAAPRHKVEDRNKLGGSQRGREKTFHSHSDDATGRPGRRQFDRRGGPDSHQRGEARKHGKGLGDNSTQTFDKEVTADVTTEAQPQVVDEKKEEAVPVKEEEIDHTLTYDQFLAQKKANQVAEDAQIQAREVAIDDKQWKKVKALEKPTESAEEKAAAVEPKQTKSKKSVTLTEFAAGSASASSTRGSGNYRDSRGSRQNFNLQDQSAFPSLK